MNFNFSQTITQIINKGKKALYLVLKKKPLPVEILETLSVELEDRYEKFLNLKLPLLKKIKPDNPEQFYECFFIRAMIEVLKEMLSERKINLSEKDLKTFEIIFQKETQKNEKKNDGIKLPDEYDNGSQEDETIEEDEKGKDLKNNDDKSIKIK